MTTPHPLVAALKAHRLSLGLTVQQVADQAGMAASTIRGWESGDKDPSLVLAEMYANGLGLSLRPVPLRDAARDAEVRAALSLVIAEVDWPHAQEVA